MNNAMLVAAMSCTALNVYAGGQGIPSRASDLDVLPGFQNPPPGYGEVPFWWWTGDTPDSSRLIEQIKKLHEKGISGVQVNYSHYDTPGWMTEQDSPNIFSEEWWSVYEKVAQACADRDMGIGLSTYTLDWPNGANNLFNNFIMLKKTLKVSEFFVSCSSLFVFPALVIFQKSLPCNKSNLIYAKSCKIKRNFEDILRTP